MKLNNKEKYILSGVLAVWGVFLVSSGAAMQKQIKPIKFKEANKYPEIVKDLAFVVNNDVESEIIKNQIKHSGGRLLDSVEVFDIYQMENEKSIAYKLTFKDNTRTLSDEEVMEVFNKIIKEVETKTTAKLRS